eukprot:scaffold4760_cov113-Isochrysis_galbana.AAC.15
MRACSWSAADCSVAWSKAAFCSMAAPRATSSPSAARSSFCWSVTSASLSLSSASTAASTRRCWPRACSRCASRAAHSRDSSDSSSSSRRLSADRQRISSRCRHLSSAASAGAAPSAVGGGAGGACRPEAGGIAPAGPSSSSRSPTRSSATRSPPALPRRPDKPPPFGSADRRSGSGGCRGGCTGTASSSARSVVTKPDGARPEALGRTPTISAKSTVAMPSNTSFTYLPPKNKRGRAGSTSPAMRGREKRCTCRKRWGPHSAPRPCGASHLSLCHSSMSRGWCASVCSSAAGSAANSNTQPPFGSATSPRLGSSTGGEDRTARDEPGQAQILHRADRDGEAERLLGQMACRCVRHGGFPSRTIPRRPGGTRCQSRLSPRYPRRHAAECLLRGADTGLPLMATPPGRLPIGVDALQGELHLHPPDRLARRVEQLHCS